ncbi:MAG TPA: YCF48-related protein, partial [Pyrinomonadaceae bacterium]|nr:YCF48-related protein [Pyrinomonadaceae bacterium]
MIGILRSIRNVSVWRRLALLAVVCAIGSHPVAAQSRGSIGWSWQNPRPQGNTLLGIAFAPDKEVGIAVGTDGTILRTENGGFDWIQATAPVGTTLSGVFVRDSRRAIAVGVRGTIVATENGGKDWGLVKTDVRDHLAGVTFAGDAFSTGWAVGTYGRIMKSTDGGMTWGNQAAGTTEHLTGISARGASLAAATGRNGVVLVTGDGGTTWKKTEPCGGKAVNSTVFVSPQSLVAAGTERLVAGAREHDG